MQKKINHLKIEVLIVTLIQLILIGTFLTLYLFNAWDMDKVVLPEHIAYFCSIIGILDCFYIWRILFAVIRIRKETDIRTSDIIGSDIQEAYLFGKLGFLVTDEDGTILWESDLFIQRSLNLINDNIYEWCPKLKDFIDKEKGNVMNVNISGVDYSVKFLRSAGLFIFKDVSDYETLYKTRVEQATCIGIINIDNYNDITAINDENTDLIVKVKSIITEYARDYNILLRAIRSDSYFAVCNYTSLFKMEQDKFSILDSVKKIEFHDEIKPTLSIGFAHDFPDVTKLNEMASNAIEIAMSRGGDQAVVSKYGSELEYFGGKSNAIESTNKVKVREFSNALMTLIRKSSNVIIMGHTNMDMDALGSSLGVLEICNYCGKNGHVVYDSKFTERKTRGAITTMFTKDEFDKYFINKRDAVDKVKPQTLVVVCDISRPKMTMCPEVLEKAEKVVVIDHHRRAEDFIEKPVLVQIDASASSASELVVEMVKYNSEKEPINVEPRIATIMLSGIFLDTGFYKSKTVGLRTFEASMILKEKGADNAKADDLLKDEYEEYLLINKIVASMKTPYYGVVYCIGPDPEPYEQSTLAKAANACIQLKGIYAVFVIGKVSENEIKISARSDGTINVQTLCEKLGGGGHFSMAAALLKDTTLKNAEEQLLNVLANNLSQAKIDKDKGE